MVPGSVLPRNLLLQVGHSCPFLAWPKSRAGLSLERNNTAWDFYGLFTSQEVPLPLYGSPTPTCSLLSFLGFFWTNPSNKLSVSKPVSRKFNPPAFSELSAVFSIWLSRKFFLATRWEGRDSLCEEGMDFVNKDQWDGGWDFINCSNRTCNGGILGLPRVVI